jgi:hypothetical protein
MNYVAMSATSPYPAITLSLYCGLFYQDNLHKVDNQRIDTIKLIEPSRFL